MSGWLGRVVVDSKVTFGTTRLWKDSSRPLISSTSDQIWNHLHISKQCRRRAVACIALRKATQIWDLIIVHQLSCVAEEQIQQVVPSRRDAPKLLSRITAVERSHESLTSRKAPCAVHTSTIYRTGVTLQSHSRFFWVPDCAT
jgi:hypothetical protein